MIFQIEDPDNFIDIMKVYNASLSLNDATLTADSKELIAQTTFIIETITDWLKIALSYDMANFQDQPAYKIRHIKCGVR